MTAADPGWQVTALDARGDRYPEDGRVNWQVGDVGVPTSWVRRRGVPRALLPPDRRRPARPAGALQRPPADPRHARRQREVEPFTLSEAVTLRGYRGRLYLEGDLARSTASWGNDESFWPRTRALYRMLGENGYEVLTAAPWYLPTRTFFLCLPGMSRSSRRPAVAGAGRPRAGRRSVRRRPCRRSWPWSRRRGTASGPPGRRAPARPARETSGPRPRRLQPLDLVGDHAGTGRHGVEDPVGDEARPAMSPQWSERTSPEDR